MPLKDGLPPARVHQSSVSAACGCLLLAGRERKARNDVEPEGGLGVLHAITDI